MISIIFTIVFVLLLVLSFGKIVQKKFFVFAIIGLISLSTFFIYTGNDNLSEIFAVLAFLSLIAGVIFETFHIHEKEKAKRHIEYNKLHLNIFETEQAPSKNSISINFSAVIIGFISFVLTILLVTLLLGKFEFMKISSINIPLDFSKINIFKDRKEDEELLSMIVLSTPYPTQKTIDKKAINILLKNGTLINGLASKSSLLLKNKGYERVEIGNAKKRDYAYWYIYFSEGLEKEAEKIKLDLNIDNVVIEEKIGTESADIIVIAGTEK